MRVAEQLMLIGPNRRSEHTIVEQQLVPEETELAALAADGSSVVAHICRVLPAFREGPGPLLPAAHDRSPPLEALARLYTAVALSLQRLAGHRVRESGFERDRGGGGVWAWFEYEHQDVGLDAAELALRLVTEALVAGCSGTAGAHGPDDVLPAIEAFRAGAARCVLPRDAEAIARVAARLDIPCVKLERHPYPGLSGEFRIRAHSLLLLGHARHRQIVDGTFCVSRCVRLHPLVRDRVALLRLLASKGLQLSPEVPGRDAVPGDVHRLLVAGGEPLVLVQGGREAGPDRIHPATRALARELARSLDVGMLLLDIVTRDIGLPLADTGGAVLGVDLAPELDALLAAESGYFDAAAEAFLRWLFPPGSPFRIPIVAVTGTNGKTTTTRMVAHILRQAGFHTGMVCSEGVHLDGRFEATRSDVGPGVHHFLLDRTEVEAAVFEEYFGRIVRAGFAYGWCDVAVCTNVTNDHLGRIGIHTLEQMAEVKRAVPMRARKAAVLNADDPHCLAMAEWCTAERICLVSTREDSPAFPMTALGSRAARCIVELESGRPWAVLYDDGQRMPLLPVADIPATRGGTATFNVSNALHAAAAAYFAGAGRGAIAAGLRSFEMSFANTPGRLNHFEGLPFLVIMDYAHNADGFRQLCSYVDRLPVDGRKILMVGFTGDRKDPDILAAVAELAGHFDRYICRNFRNIRQREIHEIPALVARGLEAAGVETDCIDVEPVADRAVARALGIARQGDLVVLLVGESEIRDVWQRLNDLRAAQAASTDLSPVMK